MSAVSQFLFSTKVFLWNSRLTYLTTYSTSSLGKFMGILNSAVPKLNFRSSPQNQLHLQPSRLSRCQLHPSTGSGQKPWSHSWLFLSSIYHKAVFSLQNISQIWPLLPPAWPLTWSKPLPSLIWIPGIGFSHLASLCVSLPSTLDITAASLILLKQSHIMSFPSQTCTGSPFHSE